MVLERNLSSHVVLSLCSISVFGIWVAIEAIEAIDLYLGGKDKLGYRPKLEYFEGEMLRQGIPKGEKRGEMMTKNNIYFAFFRYANEREKIQVSAERIRWAMVMEPTMSLLGVADPLGTLAAFRSNTEAGGA